MPGVNVHHTSGRTTAIVDTGVRLADIMLALGDVAPGARLVEAISNVGTTMLVFDQDVPQDGEAT
ncbi:MULTISPECIES: hypothetical protein [Frankia]|nr:MULTISPECIES: hypothetical protein [Frankia]